MKAAIFNPYWDSLGGGERYTASVAQILSDNGFRVDLEWKDPGIKSQIQTRFGLDLEGVEVVESVRRGDGYDVCFWLSDGSIPLLAARKNILHFQFPFKNVSGKNLLNRMKFFRINHIVCNSVFTKGYIDQEYGVSSLVLYPPVDVAKIKPRKKEPLILYIGRFSQLTQAKRQDVIIGAFKRFFDGSTADKSWQLVLAGGAEVGADEYLKQLKEQARTYPIKIVASPSFSEIQNWYSRAMFFWSASGYKIEVDRNPLGVEHFGMTVVEAMAGGCIPLVYDAGGHREIIEHEKNGFLWKNTGELVKWTEELIKDKNRQRTISLQSHKDSLKFSYESFEKELLKLIY